MKTTHENSKRVERLRQVEARIGRSRASIYEMIARGTFPPPIPIGERAVGWLTNEIDAWLDARIAERDQAKAAKATDAPSCRDSRVA